MQIHHSLHGSVLGLSKDNELIARGGFAAGQIGSHIVYPNGRYVALFDDFLGDVIADQWSAAKGSDGAAAIAGVRNDNGGWARQTTGATAVVAESCVSMTHSTNYKVGNGGIIFEARVKPITSVANVQYFIGLTDTVATSALEQPMTLTTATMAAVADDCVGFLYDTAATTPLFYGTSVKATVATTLANSIACGLPVADTATTLRIELDALGNAVFYQDGSYKGRIATCITPTIALTPVVEAMARTTAAKSIDCDYVHCAALRV